MKIGYITQANTKGQIVIPQAIRKALGIDPGAPLHLTIQGQGMYLAPISDVIEKKTTDDTAFREVLRLTRGAWGDDPEERKREKTRHTFELAATRRLKKAW